MRHDDYWHTHVAAILFQEAREIPPTPPVQRCEGLVQQQQFGRGNYRTGQRHAAALAARQVLHRAVKQILEFEQARNLEGDRRIAGGRPPVLGIVQVSAHSEMREQPRVLEHQTDSPFVRGNTLLPIDIFQHAAVERHASGRKPM